MSDQLKTEASLWERSTTRRFFRWLFSRRGIRRALIVLAWAVTIIGLLYGEESWRGRRAWNQYREAAEARGVSLDFKSYIPKPVPDDQNFAATPFLKSIIQSNSVSLPDDLYAHAANTIVETNLAKDRGRRHFTDLAAWQLASAALQRGELVEREHYPSHIRFETDKADPAARAAAAPAVLEGLKPDAPVFAELRAAGTREYSRYPLAYDLENPWAIKLPHLAGIRMVCDRLKLEACAELAAGQSGQALADVKLMLLLADSVKSEPFLISFLVRLGCVQMAIQPVWEGLAEHRWSDAQLQELQARFLSYDFLADIEPALKCERAVGVQLVSVARKMGLGDIAELSEGLQQSYAPDDELPLYLIGRVIPSGWYYLEKLNYSKLFDAQMDGIVDVAAKRVSPHKAAINAEELERQIYGGWGMVASKAILCHRVIAKWLLPGLNGIHFRAATAKTAADEAALACALERYRLANGQFPETLEALPPRFISRAPNDVITGQPYKYRRAADGQFILYSVGWNEKDDGGAPGKGLFDKAQGDWVWSYPAQ
jgi:hypothetical protein